MSPPLRICLWGQFGVGNFGNDASLEAMLLFLRRALPDAELTCVCSTPERAALDFAIKAEPIAWRGAERGAFAIFNKLFFRVPGKIGSFFDALARARRFDAFIIPGTGILDDFRTGPLGLPYDVFRWCLAARLGGAKVALVSIGAGPIRHWLARALMKNAARAAHRRSYRDQFSMDYLAGLGLDVSHDGLYPDLAFALPAPRAGAPGDPLTIGLGVMAYVGWSSRAADAGDIYRAYVAKMARFIEAQLREGRRVRLVIGEDGDAATVADVIAALAPETPRTGLIQEPGRTMHDALAQFAQCDIVVAARFHNLVAALMLARPTISLSYAPKNEALLAGVGLGEFSPHVERFEVEQLNALVDRLVAEAPRRTAEIVAAVAAHRARLAEQEAQLLTEILMPQGGREERAGATLRSAPATPTPPQ